MVIHHGGAGTTSAGLRSGIPNIVIPLTADQYFWARKVYAIGAGPKPIPVQKLSVENLTQWIFLANNNAMQKRAQNIGQELRNEAGIHVEINLIEKYSNNFLRNNI